MAIVSVFLKDQQPISQKQKWLFADFNGKEISFYCTI